MYLTPWKYKAGVEMTFQEVIEAIGLPWDRYKKYVANLKERFTDERLLT